MYESSQDEVERAADTRGFIRLSGLAYVTPLCFVFMYVDYFWYPQYFRLFTGLRAIEFVLTILLVRFARSERPVVMERWLALYVAIVTWEIHLVLFTIGEPATDYYAGLIMIPVGLAGELGSRWRWYVFNLGQVFVPYLMFGLLRGGDQVKNFTLNLVFMTSITVISTVGRWFAGRLQDRERQLRRQLQSEVEARDRVIEEKTREAIELQSKRVRLNEEFARVNERMLVTEQVAHDIRSPLSALTMTLSHAASLPSEYRDLVRDAVARIRDIADDLLSRARLDRKRLARESAPFFDVLVGQIVAEKRLSYQTRVRLTLRVDATTLADVSATEFQRVLSNLIDNAVEASAVGSEVKISLIARGKMTEVQVKDSGRGIAADVLPLLGRRGYSFGKRGGTGLGLHHAKRFAFEAGGDLTIASEPERGTAVTLSLPNAPPPGWLLDVLDVTGCDEVVVLDDDPAVGQAWRRKLNRPVVIFDKASTLRTYVEEMRPGSRPRFLIDFDYGDLHANGLDLIRELGLALRSVLVTGRYNDEDVQEAAVRTGVRVIPKSWIEAFPVLDR